MASSQPNRKVPFLALLGAFARLAVGILRLELLVDLKVLIPPGKDRIALAGEDVPADGRGGRGCTRSPSSRLRRLPRQVTL